MQDTDFERRMDLREDRAKAIQWARDILSRSDWVVLDTETTSKYPQQAKIVQLGIVAPDGGTLLDVLLNPVATIPDGSRGIHGIGLDNVRLALTFPELYPALLALLRRKTVVVYNVGYDRTVLTCELQRFGLPPLSAVGWECAMMAYADYVGQWDDYHGNNRWQPLPPLDAGRAHGAVADCLSTIAVMKKMAGEADGQG